MKRTIIIGLIMVTAFAARAQDVHFSQFNQVPLLLNPASAGAYDGYYRAILNYRNQWANMGKPFSTYMGSFDMPIRNKRNYNGAYWGLGAYMFSDKAGDGSFSTTQGNVTASVIVPVSDNSRLSAGLQAGVVHRSVNIDAIQWPNQYNGQGYDPTLPSNEKSTLGTYFYFDMATGLHYHYVKNLSRFQGRSQISFNTGVALYNALKLFQRYSIANMENIYPRIVVHANLRRDLENSRIGLVPSLLFMKQGPAYEIDAGFLLRIRTGKETNITGFLTESAFLFGAHYRYKDAVIPQIFFEVANLGIGISYDVNISSFSTATKFYGGFEVSLRYSKMRGALYRNL